MKAMILAAGLGTRLLPATKSLPKPCFPILTTPIIVHIINSLKEAGVTEIVINLHHLPEKIKEAVNKYPQKGVKIHYSYEDEILGTAGGIKRVQNILSDGAFILHNGDIFSEIDLKAAAKFHKGMRAKATMIVKAGDHPSFIGLDSGSLVARFPYGELKTSDDYAQKTYFTGIHIIEPDVFDYIPPDTFYGINSSVYPNMLTDGLKISGYVTDSLWRDIGTPEDFLEANFAKLDLYETSTPLMRAGKSDAVSIIKPSLIGEGTKIGRNCKIGAYAIIGNNCKIEDDCAISHSVIFDSTTVKKSTIVNNSMILDDCTIIA